MRRVALYITLAVLAVALVVVSVPNITALMGRAEHARAIEYALASCRYDRRTDCHVEDVYDGLMWVGYDVIGE